MKNLAFIVGVLLVLALQSCAKLPSALSSVSDYESDAKPITHELWTEILQKHVSENGDVDYKGIKADSVQFNKYIDLLSSGHPNEKHWTRNEQLAYWINAYNAYTVQLILDNYPVKSIKDIKSGQPFLSDTWTIEFINIEERTYNLNNIEHGIIRPDFKEPRIHFAVNCASISCPKLRNEAYTADKLEQQLTEQTEEFLRTASKNKFYSADKIKVSKLFDWFKGDFKDAAPTVIDFINKYAPIQVNKNATVEFMDYDWNLNDVGTAK